MSGARTKTKSRQKSPVYPIVLVHGLLGFATIGPRGKLEYFRGVMRHLENNRKVLRGKGKVYVADLDPTDTIPSRAIQLRDFVQAKIYDHKAKRYRYEKVNIIAHSMGGLDARYMIANLSMDTGDRSPMADRVASLTTIGTPHLGTSFADSMLALPAGQSIVDWANLYSITIGAFEQLSVKWLVTDAFNDRMPDCPQVEYFSYAGDVPVHRVLPFMTASALIIRRNDGANDGLVAVDSAIFRYQAMEEKYPQVLPADHASQIGHGYAHLPIGPQRFDHLDFYSTLANALAERELYFPHEGAVNLNEPPADSRDEQPGAELPQVSISP